MIRQPGIWPRPKQECAIQGLRLANLIIQRVWTEATVTPRLTTFFGNLDLLAIVRHEWSMLTTKMGHPDLAVRLWSLVPGSKSARSATGLRHNARNEGTKMLFTPRHLNGGMKDKRFEDLSKSSTRDTVQRRPNSTRSMKLSSARLSPLARLTQTPRALEQASSLLPIETVQEWCLWAKVEHVCISSRPKESDPSTGIWLPDRLASGGWLLWNRSAKSIGRRPVG